MNTETAVFLLLRLGFEGLWTLSDWKKLLVRAGFGKIRGSDEGFSQQRSYKHLAKRAKELGHTDLATDYEFSAANIARGYFSWAFLTAQKEE